MKTRFHDILKKYWGYDDFRPLQLDIVESIASGKDTLALLPTGGGKSICFQVPAMAMEGICIVISPLIALMKDQVENLHKRKIKAAAIFSGMSNDEIERNIANCLFDKNYKFLYISPERLKTDRFLINLQKMKVSFFAIDEAHCISQWGYDFRPPYLQIAEVRKFFPKAPVLALTATATPEVVKDIQLRLQFKKENVFQKSFKRDNLSYIIVKEENKMGRMLKVMEHYKGTGIVYVRNRRKTKEIAEYLQQSGISADYYNAGLDNNIREEKQRRWMNGETRVIVSTNAFGMGIDKPDVRFVIHLDIPDSLEAYFQEAGRGGRDLKPSVAILFYDEGDIRELKKNFTLSFPEIETIRRVYYEICNFYRIALGSGENKIFNYPMEEIAQKVKLNYVELHHCINFLEKTGVLTLSDSAKKNSTLIFNADNETLENFYRKHPDLEDFIKTILRSYGGIFSNFVKISEEEIAKRTELTIEKVEEYLKEIQRWGILTYRPRDDKPHIIFLQNRIDENYLYFSDQIYKQRKEVAEKRLEAVLNFINDDKTCRSVSLLRYFGEKKSSRCGGCDVCIKMNKETVGKKEFDDIIGKIRTLRKQNPKISRQEIIEKMIQRFPEKKVLYVLRIMIDHNEL